MIPWGGGIQGDPGDVKGGAETRMDGSVHLILDLCTGQVLSSGHVCCYISINHIHTMADGGGGGPGGCQGWCYSKILIPPGIYLYSGIYENYLRGV